MPISYIKKFIFIHIPKTAGSSIAQALRKQGWLASNRKYLFGKITKGNFAYSAYWHHLKANDIQQIVSAQAWNSFFKFAFVRNPWERLVSAYFFAKKQVNNPTSIHWKKQYPDHFAQWLDQGPDLPLPQYEYITDQKGKLLVDFLGRFEKLEEDFARLTRIFGAANARLPHTLKSTHSHYSAYYSEETRHLATKLYRKDIELFGYTFKSVG